MGQRPLVLKAAQVLVKFWGKDRSCPRAGWEKGGREGRIISVLQTGKLRHGTSTWLFVTRAHPCPVTLGQTERGQRGVTTCSRDAKEITQGMTHMAAPGQPKFQLARKGEGDLIPAPNAWHHDLHSHRGQGVAKDTEDRGLTPCHLVARRYPSPGPN